MAQLPDLQEQARVTPQASRGIVSYQPSPVGEAMSGVGKTIGGIGADFQEKQDKLEQTYASAHLLKGQADVLKRLQDENDHTKIPQLYQEGMEKVNQEASGMIRNSAAREQFTAQSNLHTMQGLEHVNTLANTKRKQYGRNSTAENFDSLVDAASNTSDPKLGTAMLKTANNLVDSYAATDSEWLDNARTLKKAGAQKYGETWLEAQTPQDRLKYLTPQKTDGVSLAARNNNPGNLRGSDGEFREFSTSEEGAKAMRDDLMIKIRGGSQAMERNYGKGYTPTIEKLITTYAPPTENDTASYIKTVSTETGIAPDAPLTPADVEKIMPVMVKVEGGASGTASGTNYAKTGTPVDFIPIEKRAELYQRTLTQVNEENKLKVEDPAKYGARYGMSVDQIVQMQPNSQTASVMPKEVAAQQVEQIKDFTSPDAIIQKANEIKSTYSKYTYNAVKDLTDAKMPDEYQAAINLAIQDPVGNHERIKLLYEAAKVGDKGIDEAYKASTFSGIFSNAPGDPKLIEEKLVGTGSETLQAMDNEGYSLDDKVRNFKITSSVAKAYRIKNPSVGEDDAVNYAMGLETDRYRFAKLNGTQYRVPRAADGVSYDVDAIEERLAAHFETIEFKSNVVDEAIAKNVGQNLKKLAVPFLNSKQDGVRFRSPSGEILLDKSGKIAELKFKDVIGLPTPEEIRQERINKSFE